MLKPGKNGPSDRELLLAVRAGDPAAIQEFIRRMACVPLILAAQNARMGRPLAATDLHDVAQETLMLVWQRLGSFEGRSTLETWVYRFCSLVLMNAVRKVRRAKRRQQGADTADEPAGENLELRYLEFDELHQCLDQLPAEEAAVVRLKHFEDRTFDEIGSRLSISSNTVKTQYYRALRKLHEAMTRGQRGGTT